MAQPNENISKSRFHIVDDDTKNELLQNSKALNTNRATKQWVLCLIDFLKERNMPDVDHLDLDELPNIIGDFYFSAPKKRISEEGIQPKDNEKKQK